MDIPMTKNIHGSEGSSDSSEHSKSGELTPMPLAPTKPITVQELGNIYAEWRMANQSSSGSEEWMTNQMILLIPVPKRPFNWKCCWIVLVTCAIALIGGVGIAYFIDNHTSYKIVSPKRGIEKLRFDHETTTKEIQLDVNLMERLHDSDRILNRIEEDRKSREEMMRQVEDVQRAVEQSKAFDSYLKSIQEYENHQEIHRSQSEDENLKDKVREILSHLPRKHSLGI